MEPDADSTQLWERRHADLRRWRDAHGNCNVPKAEGKLGRWVVRQRELHKKGKLDAPRKALLDALGFVWNTNEAAWHARYTLLREYTARNGHCCVPISDPALGMWVAKMRANRRRGKLPAHRVRLLDQLRFVWNTAEADWMDKFEKLLAFREREGHACVPFNEGELGWWVNTQRQSKRKGKLSEHRRRLLDQAGFIWNPQEFLAARRREAATLKARPGQFAATTIAASSGFLHGTRKRTAAVAFPSMHQMQPYSPGEHETFFKRIKAVPLSPLSQRPLFRQATESVATNSTGLSRLIGPDTALTAEAGPEGTPIRPLRMSLVNAYGSPLAESTSSNHTGRADVQSIASLLSPSFGTPAEVISQGTAVPIQQYLDTSELGVGSSSELPSFHTGRSTLACVAGSKRGPYPHDFVLPPISSLQVLSHSPRI